MTRKRWAAVLTIAGLALGSLFPLGCGDNPDSTVLDPPGGSGGVSGILQFQGVGGAPFPEARITPDFKAPSLCSGFGAIVLAGSFNGFSLNDPDYAMKHISDCGWLVEATFDTGDVSMKFVTGNDANSVAFDNPGDYGKSGQGGVPQPLSGTLDNPTNGLGNDLTVTLPVAGLWTVVLDESEDPATYLFTRDNPLPLSDPQTGAFQIEALAVGTYDFTFTAEGFLSTTVRNVVVAKNRAVDLGTVVMEVASGKLTGLIAFGDDPVSRPSATVNVFVAGSGTPVATTETDSAFVFVGLETGRYDIVVTAAGYQEGRLEGIDFVNGTNQDVGTITLVPGCSSDFTTIQIAGDFNGFNLADAPFMTQVACVWTDTLTLSPATYNFKFVTDGSFDNPMDYGGTETPLTVPGTYPTSLVQGIGTAITISVLSDGDYEFVLDETVPEFTVRQLGGAAAEGSIVGSVGFTGISGAPLPRASVVLFQAGSSTALISAVSDTNSGAFAFASLPDGAYDVAVSAPCFEAQTRTAIEVSGTEVDLGEIVLAEGASAFTTIQMVGQFTDPPFDLSVSPAMAQDSACSWSATVTLDPGAYLFKFVTDGVFDDPKDYGGDEQVVLTLPGTFATRQVSGQGTALNIEVTSGGEYHFVLDERLQRFEATLEAPLPAPDAGR